MAEHFASAALVGCTGLVGSQIFKTLASLPSNPTIHAFARHALPLDSPNVKAHISSESSAWPDLIKGISPTPNVFISAIGVTKAQAGSLEAQRKIDLDLNVTLAQAAKDSGVKIYVLISSATASSGSKFPYYRLKADVEEAIKAIGFPYTVFIKPGLLLGERSETRIAEGIARGVAKGLGSISKGLTDGWAQDVDLVGRAAVSAGIQCAEGQKSEGVWLVDQAEIIKLGRTEWK